jgi:hypothetical protein
MANLSRQAWFPSAKFAAAEPHSLGDWGRFEQLMDFASMHRFRRSIFCRAGKNIDQDLVPHRLSGLWANAEIERLAPEADTPDTFVFRAGNGAEIETRDPYFADFLTRLGARPFQQVSRSTPLKAILIWPSLCSACSWQGS